MIMVLNYPFWVIPDQPDFTDLITQQPP